MPLRSKAVCTTASTMTITVYLQRALPCMRWLNSGDSEACTHNTHVYKQANDCAHLCTLTGLAAQHQVGGMVRPAQPQHAATTKSERKQLLTPIDMASQV
jgi:hypothetical protein